MMNVQTSAFSHGGGVREYNEDAFLDLPKSGIWLVADGMGGYQAGDVASQLICDTVTGEQQRHGGILDRLALERALLLANRRIRQYGEETLSGHTLGSTVVALLVEHYRYHLFWAGDSRCYRVRRGEIAQLSTDHSQVAEMVAQGVIAAEDAECHPLAHVITRALGVDDNLELDYQTGAVEPGDRFMLCSDGVSKELNLEELRGFLIREPIEEVSQAMMHSLLIKKCNDNITCIIVKFSEDCYSPGCSAGRDDHTIPVNFRFT
ncbi:PP2C family serine/threonine-protein phosphatase [uncultured Marinobacter sp.]|uniref:PP2C family protein-serine/threonine phosphatase n=1 Tax=uncultured Marinobacter sp. TaxID=187379 RepID=UPI0030D74E56